MTECKHYNYDDYFDRCEECNIEFRQSIASGIRADMQAVYRKYQDLLGIDSGDITPELSEQLEYHESQLADTVADWLELARDNEY